MFNFNAFPRENSPKVPPSPLEEAGGIPDYESVLSDVEEKDSRYAEALRNLKEGDASDIEFLREKKEELLDLRDLLDSRLDLGLLSMDERDEIEGARTRVVMPLGELSEALESFDKEENPE